MVAPRLRSRSLVKKKVKTPGGKRTIHYKKKASSFSKCGGCGRNLLGVPKKNHRKLTLSQRKPNRPYGGSLCNRCTRALFKEKARG